MLGNGALESSVLPLGLRGHPLGVNVSGREREPTLAVGVDGVLALLDASMLESGRKTHLIDLLDLGPDHDHHVTMLHDNLKNIMVGGSAPLLVGRQEELGVALGPEAHRGRRAQSEGGHDGAELGLAVIMVLCLRRVSMGRENTGGDAR